MTHILSQKNTIENPWHYSRVTTIHTIVTASSNNGCITFIDIIAVCTVVILIKRYQCDLSPAWLVTNMSKLSQSLLIAKISHQHRWNSLLPLKLAIAVEDFKWKTYGYIDVGDKWMLVTIFGCWCPTLTLKDRGCWWWNRLKPSPTSQSCRQHISSPTSVTNIDLAKTYQCTHIQLYIRTQMIQQCFCKCDRFAWKLKVLYLILILILTVQVWVAVHSSSPSLQTSPAAVISPMTPVSNLPGSS